MNDTPRMTPERKRYRQLEQEANATLALMLALVELIKGANDE